MTAPTQISFVVPLFNEQEIFPMLVERLNKVMDSVRQKFEAVLVDDGSFDRTAELMQVTALRDARYHCIFLSRNFGHQAALSAGLAAVRATEAVFCIDGDLQDPPELFAEFYKLFKEGNEIVFGVRKNRKANWYKRSAYHLYYRLLKRIVNIEVNLDSGDFAMISRRAVDILNALPEESRYVRGLRSWIGFKQTSVKYDRPDRAAGTSKYTFRMLFRLAYNGIFNFSDFPIKLITAMGFSSVGLAISYFTYTFIKKFILGIPVIEGFTGLLFAITLFSGVQLLSLGIIGEYLYRILFQVKGRPLFIVKSRIVDGKTVG